MALRAGRQKRAYPQDRFYSTDVFGDYALDFIELARKEKKPFFQYLAFNAPHFPLHAKPEDIKKYAGTYTEGWDQLRAARHRLAEHGTSTAAPRNSEQAIAITGRALTVAIPISWG